MKMIHSNENNALGNTRLPRLPRKNNTPAVSRFMMPWGRKIMRWVLQDDTRCIENEALGNENDALCDENHALGTGNHALGNETMPCAVKSSQVWLQENRGSESTGSSGL